jgi:hypothetical protein
MDWKEIPQLHHGDAEDGSEYEQHWLTWKDGNRSYRLILKDARLEMEIENGMESE